MHGVRLVATPAANSSATAANGRSRSVDSRPSARSGTGTLAWERGFRDAIRRGGRRGVAARDVALQDGEELGYDPIALEGHHQPAVHEHGRLRFLERAG